MSLNYWDLLILIITNRLRACLKIFNTKWKRFLLRGRLLNKSNLWQLINSEYLVYFVGDVKVIFISEKVGIKLSWYNQIIHNTDLEFSSYCKNMYKVNRGIYNTIDSWFYNQGVKNILHRRKKIIDFLNYLQSNNTLSFGKGGLTHKLNEFNNSSGI